MTSTLPLSLWSQCIDFLEFSPRQLTTWKTTCRMFCKILNKNPIRLVVHIDGDLEPQCREAALRDLVSHISQVRSLNLQILFQSNEVLGAIVREDSISFEHCEEVVAYQSYSITFETIQSIAQRSKWLKMLSLNQFLDKGVDFKDYKTLDTLCLTNLTLNRFTCEDFLQGIADNTRVTYLFLGGLKTQQKTFDKFEMSRQFTLIDVTFLPDDFVEALKDGMKHLEGNCLFIDHMDNDSRMETLARYSTFPAHVRRAISFSLTAQTKRNFTPLHFGVYIENYKLFDYALRLCPDVSMRDHRGNTPLSRAVLGKNLIMTKILLESGADLSLQNHEFETPFYQACLKGDYELVLVLVTACFKNRSKLLRGLTVFSHEKSLENLRKYQDLLHLEGSNVGKHQEYIAETELLRRTLINDYDAIVDCDELKNLASIIPLHPTGEKCLHAAALVKSVAILEVLLKCGFDIEERDKYGMTALTQALLKRDECVSLYLLQKGAVPHLEGPVGKSINKTLNQWASHQLKLQLFPKGNHGQHKRVSKPKH